MIGVDELLAPILADMAPLPATTVDVIDGVGCVLASDLVAIESLPPFANSAMDGFAVRRVDLARGAAFRLVDILPAGQPARRTIGEGEAASIATGGMLPDGADAVVPTEQAMVEGDLAVFHGSIPRHGHVRPAGEDVQTGALVAHAGEILTRRLATVAMATGARTVDVIPCPRVGILTTGDELVDLNARLTSGTIRDTNRALLAAGAEALGFQAVSIGRSRDDASQIADRVTSADAVDIVLISGGLGKGARDVVVDAIARIGTVRAFEVAMRPGKPFAFGTVEGRPVFAVPGNPVAALAAFSVLVAPALRRLAGRVDERPGPSAKLTGDLSNTGGRRHLVRVRLEWVAGTLSATPVDRHGSGIISSLAAADGFLVIPETIEHARAGDVYDVIPFAPKEWF